MQYLSKPRPKLPQPCCVIDEWCSDSNKSQIGPLAQRCQFSPCFPKSVTHLFLIEYKSLVIYSGWITFIFSDIFPERYKSPLLAEQLSASHKPWCNGHHILYIISIEYSLTGCWCQGPYHDQLKCGTVGTDPRPRFIVKSKLSRIAQPRSQVVPAWLVWLPLPSAPPQLNPSLVRGHHLRRTVLESAEPLPANYAHYLSL